MQELFSMFFPEYTITPDTLRNIANIEYAKAVVENTVILPTWEENLKRQCESDFIVSCFELEKILIDREKIKKVVNGYESSQQPHLVNHRQAFSLIRNTPKYMESAESDYKNLHRTLTNNIVPKNKQGAFRNSYIKHGTKPEEILAEVVQLFDWVNSNDARMQHPIIVSAIFYARLEQIHPFEVMQTAVNGCTLSAYLQSAGYTFNGYLPIIDYFSKGIGDFRKNLENLWESTNVTNDYTKWIEYFTQGFAMQAATLQERVKLLARDTKIAKVSGRIKLTPRQEKIVEYLQDYGNMQNKDFVRIFPKKSEDSILRDLKMLIEQGIVKKVGSTKSSRYELK